MIIKIYKVKEGKLPKLLQWAQELSTLYRAEVLETLKEEQVTREGLGIFTNPDGEEYVVGFIEGEQLPSTDRDLNKRHKEVMRDCLDPISNVDIKYDFSIEPLTS